MVPITRWIQVTVLQYLAHIRYARREKNRNVMVNVRVVVNFRKFLKNRNVFARGTAYYTMNSFLGYCCILFLLENLVSSTCFGFYSFVSF